MAVWTQSAGVRAGADAGSVDADDLRRRAVEFVADPDVGRPVSWSQLILGRPDPTSPDNVDKTNGRGLFLIRTFMDEVRFNESGNEITMVKRFSSPH